MTKGWQATTSLFNYSLPEREKQLPLQRIAHSSLKKRTKDNFVHASFRFVLHNTPSTYLLQKTDAVLEWSAIDQVLAYGEANVCPICLDDVICPKITRCGHVFCFVCLLRYIRQSGNLSRRCPLCFTDVAIKDLKSFTMKLANVPPSVGSRLELNLLYRNKSWVIPTLEEVNMECIPSHLDSHAKFSRYVLATQEYFVQIKQDEKDALDCLYCNTMDELAKPYIQAAMNIINADDIPIVVEQKTRAFGEKDNVEYCSFYQASSGAYVFLHPFSMKCLMYEMANRKKQDTGNLPSVISGKVLESTRIEMTELNRSKYRFLGHLPMYCEFYLCDVDLGSVLSPRTKAHFKKEFRRRHQVRVRKMNDRPIDVPMRIPQVFHQEQMDFAYGIDGMVTSNFVNEELAQELQNVQVEHHASDKVASFATITQANGYFPTLGNPAAVQAAPSGAWNSATTEPLVAPAIAASSKKKKKFTKSRTLFSGSQRSYT